MASATEAFYFQTRSLSEDYRVFRDGGNARVNSSEYETVLRRAHLTSESEDRKCASLFVDSGRAHLVGSALQRGVSDVAGRPIRFSFCWLTVDDGREERSKIYSAFLRLTNDWEGAEQIMRSLISEIKRADPQGEDIRFDDNAFIAWLLEGSARSIVFEPCDDGDIVRLGAFAWPDDGCVLKWRPDYDSFKCLKNKMIRSR